MPAATAPPKSRRFGVNFDTFTGGAALLTNRRLDGVVLESLEEASADLVTGLPNVRTVTTDIFPPLCQRAQPVAGRRSKVKPARVDGRSGSPECPTIDPDTIQQY